MKFETSRRHFVLSGALMLLLLVAGVGFAQDSGGGMHWVGTWASSAQEVEAKLVPEGFAQLDDVTIRQIVRVSIGGAQLRVQLSNVFGLPNEPVTISSANAALLNEGHAIKTETVRPVTFEGNPSVTIPPGQLIFSDPINFQLPPGADLVVTMHVSKASRRITGHRSARGYYVFLQRGDAVVAESLPQPAKSNVWYYLCGVDVQAPASSRAIVCLGDSITDGKGSTEGLNRRWPDLLAARLRENQATTGVGVLNQGIGGNAVWRGGIGQTALRRLERDVLNQTGVKWVIVMEGINDIGGERSRTTAEDIIKAFETIVSRCKERGLKVYGTTILPCGTSFYDKGEMEGKRLQINEWVRTSGVFDAVIDWDAVVRDPENTRNLLPAADSGDRLHLSDEGYRMLAEAVDLGLFSGGSD